MNALTAIIIDDEQVSCDTIEWLIKSNCPQIRQTIKVTNPVEAIEQIKQIEPDIIFLDIEMPDMSGLELLEQFPDPSFHVIFVTAHDKFALKAFKYSAVDYLLKPVDANDLIDAIKRIVNKSIKSSSSELNLLMKTVNESRRNSELKRVALPTSNEIAIVDMDEIVYCQGDGNYSIVYLTNGTKITLSKTLRVLDEFLDGNVFFRVHNAFLINLHHIKKINRREGGSLLMDNGADLPMSRYRRQEFLAKFDYLTN